MCCTMNENMAQCKQMNSLFKKPKGTKGRKQEWMKTYRSALQGLFFPVYEAQWGCEVQGQLLHRRGDMQNILHTHCTTKTWRTYIYKQRENVALIYECESKFSTQKYCTATQGCSLWSFPHAATIKWDSSHAVND